MTLGGSKHRTSRQIRKVLTILPLGLATTLMAAAPGTGPQQLPGFEKVYGGAGRDRGVFVSPTRDGGFVAVGMSQSSETGDEDVYLVRTDSEGELLWSRNYGGSASDNGWSVHEIASGLVIAGFTDSFGSGGFDFYLMKTDARGDLVWSETYGGTGDDRAWALSPTSDGGLAILGETTSFGAGEEDCLLIKTDSSGTEIWSKTFGGENGDRCFSFVEAGDGGYMLAGQTYSEGAGDRDVYVIKTGPTGELEWSKTFGGKHSDVGHYIAATSDGGFVITGYTTSFSEQGDDPYLIKIDDRGEVEWTRVLPIEGSNHTLTGEQATDGGFYLVGFADRSPGAPRSALLVRATPSGHLDWSREISRAEGGESFGYTVRAMPDGGCVFTGHTTVGAAGDLDLMLVRVEDENRW